MKIKFTLKNQHACCNNDVATTSCNMHVGKQIESNKLINFLCNSPGMPTYGRSFKLSNPAKHGVHAPSSGGGTEGKYSKESGFLAYYEVS